VEFQIFSGKGAGKGKSRKGEGTSGKGEGTSGKRS